MKKLLFSIVVILLFSYAGTYAQVQQVSFESITNSLNDSTLLAGNSHVIQLRVTNTGGTDTYNSSNGFRIFSDDGATWTATSGAWLNGFSSNFLQAFINTFSIDGIGADTIAFSGISFGFPPALGLPANYDSLTYEITFGPTDLTDHGKTVCIDSSWFPPGGSWKWSPLVTTNPTVFPAWSGKKCWTIIDPNQPTEALVVSTPSLSFTAQEGGANPASQTFDVSEAAGGTIDYAAAGTAGWLTLTNASGFTPATVTAGINTTGLVAGTYTDSIQVTSTTATNSPQVVAVSLTITAAPKVLVVTPSVINFNVNTDDLNPSGWVYVSEAGGAAINYIASLVTPVPWLTVAENSVTPDSFLVTADIAAAGIGSHSATINVASGEAVNSPQSVAVNFNVVAAPRSLALSSNAITFNAVFGQGSPGSQAFQVTETGGNAISFTDSTLMPWTTSTPRTGTTPDSVDVAVDVTGLAIGSYIDTVFILSGEANNSPQWVVINLNITAAPDFVLNPDTLFFTAVEGGPNPSPQTIDVSLSDGGTVIFEAMTFSSWITIDSATGTTPSTIIVNVSNTLAPGMYLDTITVNEFLPLNGKPAYPVQVAQATAIVQFEVTAAPRNLVLTPDSATFVVSEGDVFGVTSSFQVSEASGDTIFWVVTHEPTWANALTDTGFTPASIQYEVNTAGLAPGNYYDSIWVTSPDAVNSPQFFRISLLVTACPTLILDTLFAPTAWDFNIFEGETVNFSDSVRLLSTGPTQIKWITDSLVAPFTATPSIGTTPSFVDLSYNRVFSTAGQYVDSLVFRGSPDTNSECFSQTKIFVRVTVLRPPSADTVFVQTTPAVPGMSVVVPIDITNSCSLSGLSSSLSWNSPDLTLDSISYASSALVGWTVSGYIDNPFKLANFSAIVDGATPLPQSSGSNWVNLHFTISPLAPAGFYPLTVPMVDSVIGFTRDCGAGTEVENPEVVSGGILVDTTANYVCGWVVEPDGTEIPGANVQLWVDYPTNGPIDSTVSSGIGSFAFSDFTAVPFDVYAYKEGYYPGKVENLNFGDRGVKIVLTPLPALATTSEWVDYYCDINTYLGAPLPIGSVVEAFVGSKLVGRQTVKEVGKYRFMPVYRASQQFGDPGATTGDLLTFMVNGMNSIPTGDVVYPAPGTISVQVCLEVGTSVTKECILNEGWNLVSWNVDTESDEILDVLGPYMNSIDVILGFEGGGLTYDPDLPMFSTLWQVDHLSGYWIKVDSTIALNLSITGFQVSVGTPIPLQTGWNLVSYLPEVSLDVDTGLASVTGNLMFAYGFDASNIQIYQPGSQFNTLSTLNPCAGYWLKMDRDDTLIYPGGGPGTLATPSIRNQTSAVATAAPANVEVATNWINLYSSKLTVDGQAVNSGVTLTAHAVSNDAIVGSYRMTADGRFGFMPVYAGSDISLKPGEQFYISVDGVPTDERFDWTANGERVEVLSLSISGSQLGVLPESYSLAQNYPNPFNPSTNISFTLPVAGKVKLEIFNILGGLIATPFDGEAAAGENNVVWDGLNDAGSQVATGVYLYRLTADNYTETRKMMLLK